MTTSKSQFGFALEYVSDIEATRRFFVDVLGLQVERDHPTFVQFKAQDGASYAIASDQPMDSSGGPELWWLVEDAEAAFGEMSSKAQTSMPLREMPFGKCFGIKDPAGQEIRLHVDDTTDRLDHAVLEVGDPVRVYVAPDGHATSIKHLGPADRIEEDDVRKPGVTPSK